MVLVWLVNRDEAVQGFAKRGWHVAMNIWRYYDHGLAVKKRDPRCVIQNDGFSLLVKLAAFGRISLNAGLIEQNINLRIVVARLVVGNGSLRMELKIKEVGGIGIVCNPA